MLSQKNRARRECTGRFAGGWLYIDALAIKLFKLNTSVQLAINKNQYLASMAVHGAENTKVQNSMLVLVL